ncbi:hypothetical protein TrLO_g7367 [Triparma laevis f. longispina]|uniref:Uncharacterized protein n=1 Tax=Triparma laevis f. longispina TaxID=1714387 RepID=A0A9W7E185_9STRA|nr:hypothetical protein TrLO_g7367 [Triparma laevis f. longispina]
MSTPVTPATYVTTTIGSFVQTVSFRFVGTNDLPYEDDEVQPYLIGVASIGMITTGVFLLWALFLLIWQCCLCTPPCYGIAGLKNIQNIWHVTRRLTFLRYTFLLSTLLALTSLTLCSVFGVLPLLQEIKDYEEISGTTSLAIGVIVTASQNLATSASGFLSSLQGLETQAGLCEAEIQSQTSAGGWTFPVGISSAISEANTTLALITDLNGSVNSASKSKETLDTSSDYFKKANIYLYCFLGFVIFMALPTLVFFTGVVKALVGNISPRLNSVMSKFLLPILNISLLIFVVLNFAFGLLSISSSDLCSKKGGPNKELLDFMTYYGEAAGWDANDLDVSNKESPLGILKYYTECGSNDAFFEDIIDPSIALLDDADGKLISVQGDLLQELSDAGFTGSLTEAECTSVDTGIDAVSDAAGDVKASIFEIADAVSCNIFTPIYTSLVHDTACYGIADSFAWLWISSLVFCFSVLLMNTTRRAYFDDTTINEDFDDELELGHKRKSSSTEHYSEHETASDNSFNSLPDRQTDHARSRQGGEELSEQDQEVVPCGPTRRAMSPADDVIGVETNGKIWKAHSQADYDGMLEGDDNSVGSSWSEGLASVAETTPSKPYQYISKSMSESFDSLTNTTPTQAAHKLRVSTAEALQTMSNAIGDGEDDISYEDEDQGNGRESRSCRSSRSGSFKLKKEKTKKSKY